MVAIASDDMLRIRCVGQPSTADLLLLAAQAERLADAIDGELGLARPRKIAVGGAASFDVDQVLMRVRDRVEREKAVVAAAVMGGAPGRVHRWGAEDVLRDKRHVGASVLQAEPVSGEALALMVNARCRERSSTDSFLSPNDSDFSSAWVRSGGRVTSHVPSAVEVMIASALRAAGN